MATSELIRNREEAALADKLSSSGHKLAFDVSTSVKLITHSRNLRDAEQHLLGEAFTYNWRGGHSSAEQLLHQNADPSSPDRLGHTALMCASHSGHLEVVEALLRAGAQVEARSDVGETALTVAVMRGHLNVVRSLVLDGAEPEACDANCVMAFAKQGQVSALKALPKAGVSLEARDEKGRTALIFAAMQGLAHVVDFLLRGRSPAGGPRSGWQHSPHVRRTLQ